MDTITLHAHFNGERILLDEPFELEPDARYGVEKGVREFLQVLHLHGEHEGRIIEQAPIQPFGVLTGECVSKREPAPVSTPGE